MESDYYTTFDPNDALVDEGRNPHYPAGWKKGDPVFVLNEDDNESPLYELEKRKGLDCE